MTRKFFYICVLDDENPETWKPFKVKGSARGDPLRGAGPEAESDMTMHEVKQDLLHKPAIVPLPPPPRELFLSLGLTPRSKIFDDSFDKVFGIIMDGGEIIIERRTCVDQLELLMTKIKARNDDVKYYGVSVIACYDGSDEEYYEIYSTLKEAADKVFGGCCESQVSIVPCEVVFRHQLRLEVARFRKQEPFVTVQVG